MKYFAKKDLLLWRTGGRVSEYSIFLRPRPISKASAQNHRDRNLHVVIYLYAQNRLSNQEFLALNLKFNFLGFLTLKPLPRIVPARQTRQAIRAINQSISLNMMSMIQPWGLYHKTYYSHNLWIPLIS
jgi:hypothetical protein